MKTEERLYMNILVWAHDKSVGFSDEELLGKFNLKDGNGGNYRIYTKLFRTGTNDNLPLINSEFDSAANTHIYHLSDRGMSAAIDYLSLKEARDGSKGAKRWAIWSIWIAIIIGIAQVILELCEFG